MIIEHNVLSKPWGSFINACRNEKNISVKILNLKEGQRTSLQKHKNRDELWFCVKGDAIVEVEGKKYSMNELNSSDAIFVARSELHRIHAMVDGCTIVEVSFGKFNEDDITRVEDDYGRLEVQD